MGLRNFICYVMVKIIAHHKFFTVPTFRLYFQSWFSYCSLALRKTHKIGGNNHEKTTIFDCRIIGDVGVCHGSCTRSASGLYAACCPRGSIRLS